MDIIIEKNSSGSYQSTIVGDTSNPFVSADCSTVIWNACETINHSGSESSTHKIEFQHGTYHLYPYRIYSQTGKIVDGHEYGTPFKIINNKNVLIEGNGSTFICHGQMGFALFEFSGEVTMQNLNIDWERPYVIQATVKEHNNEELKIEIDTSKYDIGTDSGNLYLRAEPYDAYEGCSFVNYIAIHDNCNVFDGYGNILQGLRDSNVGLIFENGTASWDEEANRESGNIKTVTFTVTGSNNNIPPTGAQIIIHVAAIPNDPNSRFEQINAFSLSHAWCTTLRNIHIYHSTRCALLAHQCGRSMQEIRQQEPAYNPNHPDLGYIELDNFHSMVKPGSGRCFSTICDNAHFTNCTGDIIIKNCHISGMGDDGINIHGRYYEIESINQNVVNILSEDMQPIQNDELWPVERSKLQRDESNIVSVCSSSELGNAGNYKRFRLVLNQLLPTGFIAGNLLENKTWCPNVTIRNCVFEKKNRARAILISTPGEVKITNNVFHSAGAAILIAADFFRWRESGGVKDVEISNNTFTECATSIGDAYHAGDWGRAAITIEPETTTTDNTNYGISPSGIVHRNIEIKSNTFYMHDKPILFARAVDGLTFQNNYVWLSLPPQYEENIAAQQVAFRLEGVTGWSETGTKWATDYPDTWKGTDNT